MNKQHFLTGLAAIGMSLFFSQPVFAECGPGETAVTIINPAGKVIELCVPEAAVSAIEEGNPGAVIPATCPCFSQDEVEADPNRSSLQCESFAGRTGSSLEVCSGIRCGIDDAYTGSLGYVAVSTSSYEPDVALESCASSDGRYYYNFSVGCGDAVDRIDAYDGMTKQEADACLAILKTQ